MSIHNSDAKLYESQRLTDEEDGGGRGIGNEVIDDTEKKVKKGHPFSQLR